VWCLILQYQRHHNLLPAPQRSPPVSSLRQGTSYANQELLPRSIAAVAAMPSLLPGAGANRSSREHAIKASQPHCRPNNLRPRPSRFVLVAERGVDWNRIRQELCRRVLLPLCFQVSVLTEQGSCHSLGPGLRPWIEAGRPSHMYCCCKGLVLTDGKQPSPACAAEKEALLLLLPCRSWEDDELARHSD
jgi:hypothetical protein